MLKIIYQKSSQKCSIEIFFLFNKKLKTKISCSSQIFSFGPDHLRKKTAVSKDISWNSAITSFFLGAQILWCWTFRLQKMFYKYRWMMTQNKKQRKKLINHFFLFTETEMKFFIKYSTKDIIKNQKALSDE